MIKFVDLNRCWQELKSDLLPAYDGIHTSGMVSNGKYRTLVEDQLKDMTGRKHCRLTTSGTTAIQGSLIAWNILQKKVACTNYSYVASTNQAALFNDVILFDVNENGNIVIDSDVNVDAIIPVSLFGNPVDYDTITSHVGNAKIIADCAQSLGSKYKGAPDGSLGDCSILSFATNKPVPTAGTQGAVLFDDDNMVEKVGRALNNGKLSRNSRIESHGINGNSYELQAAQIHFGLKRLEQWQSKRKQISEYYMSEFKDLPICIIKAEKNCDSNWHKFVIKTDKRDSLCEFLKQKGIDSQKHYTDNFAEFFGSGNDVMPTTEKLCATVLSIPNNQWLTDQEVKHISNNIKNFFNA
tara:strand:+ start:10882 stop:11940 length:1059 start_codon:yes stop_codon:yes gene_type:complete